MVRYIGSVKGDIMDLNTLLEFGMIPVENGYGTTFKSPAFYFCACMLKHSKDVIALGKLDDHVSMLMFFDAHEKRSDYNYIVESQVSNTIINTLEQHPNLRNEYIMDPNGSTYIKLRLGYKHTVCFPGSFDPFHFGHLSVVQDILKLDPSNSIVILIANNKKKVYTLSIDDRIRIIKDTLPNDIRHRCTVLATSDTVASFMRVHKINTIIKGVRNTEDYIYESRLALLNQLIDANVTTLLLPQGNNALALTSSTMIKEMLLFDIDTSSVITPLANELLRGAVK